MHRVQRVPVTESQGRIHTSAAGVLVTPEADPVDVQVNDNDLQGRRVPVLGPRRPVGQHDRLRGPDHPPADRHRGLLPEREEPAPEQGAGAARAAVAAAGAGRGGGGREGSAERKAQVRTVDRSERVRTYNFPENRISDHRVGYKAYNLDQVIDGDLDGVIDALAAADLEAKLASREPVNEQPAAR